MEREKGQSVVQVDSDVTCICFSVLRTSYNMYRCNWEWPEVSTTKFSLSKEIPRLLPVVFFLLLLFLAMDSHHLFKCKGTFVGHAVSVLCDLILGYKG